MPGPQNPARLDSAGQRAEKGTDEGSWQAAGAPVAISRGHIHPDQVGGMVGIRQGFHPGNRISDRLIETAVLPIQLAMGFTATVNQAIARKNRMASGVLHVSFCG